MTLSRSLPLHLAVAAMLLSSAGAALAQSAEPRPGRPTPAQMEKIFPEHKTLVLREHRARIAILQKGERCVAAAGSSQALRTCRKQERSAYRQHRQTYRDQMKDLFERNGIPVPQVGQRGRRGQWGEGRRQGPPEV